MEKREQRRELNQKIINKRLNLLKQRDDHRPDVSGKTYYEHMKEEPHRLVKKHPYDCGNSKCHICHADKLMHNKTARDKKLDEQSVDDLETFEK